MALVFTILGHHNFHHEFPNDYRNGVMWFQYDPTKWWIHLMMKLQLASNLKITSKEMIHRTKLSVSQPTKKLLYPLMDRSDFEKRITFGQQILIIENWVVNIQDYISDHPGGSEMLLAYVGKDATRAFSGGINTHSQAARVVMSNYVIAKYCNEIA